MRVRDTGWIELAGKLRPAVVLETEPDLARVAYGTTVSREWPRVVVHPDTRQGRTFSLTEVTFFYGANKEWVLPRDIRATGKRCTLELMLAIETLVEEHDAEQSER